MQLEESNKILESEWKNLLTKLEGQLLVTKIQHDYDKVLKRF